MLTTLLAFAVTPLLLVLPQSQASYAASNASTNDRPGGATVEEGLPAGMVFIPAGETIIGTDADQVERLGQKNIQPMTDISAETPRHTAHVDGFFLDVTEVTNLQWKVYLDATGRKPSDDLVEFGWGTEEIPEGQEYHPVTGISLPEIEGFLGWCGKRLPSEPEWTRAARGDDDRMYPWGPKWNSKLLQSGSTVPQRINRVGSYPDGASPFGVLDMVGNVWEWVDSPYAPFEGFKPIEYKQGRKKLTLTPSFNRTHKVGKGGCYISTRDFARIDTRISLHPRDLDAALGFRGARSDPAGGLEAILGGYRRLLPSRIPNENILDTTDVFAMTHTSYDANREVITGFHALAFAHPGPERGKSLSRMTRDSVDEPITLGLLVTTEELEAPALPPGQYVVAFKKEGESKAYKERKKEEKKKGGKKQNLPSKSDVSVPWPGVGIDDIVEDIDFPQNVDTIVYYNVNNAVVGWTEAPIAQERSQAPHSVETRDNRALKLEFSLDTVQKRVPRFTIPITLKNAWAWD